MGHVQLKNPNDPVDWPMWIGLLALVDLTMCSDIAQIMDTEYTHRKGLNTLGETSQIFQVDSLFRGTSDSRDFAIKRIPSPSPI